MSIASEDATQMAQIAIDSIASGLEFSKPLQVNLDDVSEFLKQKRGCFVTLYKDGVCCGCMGTLHSDECLAVDVANSAFNAAYADQRYEPLSVDDILDGDVEVEISVMSPLLPIRCFSEDDLKADINSDNGLVIALGEKEASFLPQMWNMYPDVNSFVAALKEEIGLERGYWSDDLKFYKFTTEEIVSEIPLDEYYESLNEDKEQG